MSEVFIRTDNVYVSSLIAVTNSAEFIQTLLAALNPSQNITNPSQSFWSVVLTNMGSGTVYVNFTSQSSACLPDGTAGTVNVSSAQYQVELAQGVPVQWLLGRGAFNAMNLIGSLATQNVNVVVSG